MSNPCTEHYKLTAERNHVFVDGICLYCGQTEEHIPVESAAKEPPTSR